MTWFKSHTTMLLRLIWARFHYFRKGEHTQLGFAWGAWNKSTNHMLPNGSELDMGEYVVNETYSSKWWWVSTGDESHGRQRLFKAMFIRTVWMKRCNVFVQQPVKFWQGPLSVDDLWLSTTSDYLLPTSPKRRVRIDRNKLFHVDHIPSPCLSVETKSCPV